MSLPLDSDNPMATEGTARNYSGWIAIAVLISFVMFMSLTAASHQKTPRIEGHDGEQGLLKEVMSAQSLEKSLGNSLKTSQISTDAALAKSLDDPIAGLVVEADRDPMAAMLYAEMRTFQKREVPVRHLHALEVSKFPEDRAFYKIYTSASLTLPQAKGLIGKLPGHPFVYEAARVQALEKAGDKDAVSHIVSPIVSVGAIILGLSMWPFLGVSLAVWMIFTRRYRAGKLDPKGIPLDAITDFDADRLAIRAAQIFAIFFLLDFIVEVGAYKLSLHLNEAELAATAGVLTAICVFAIQRLPVDGKRIQLAVLGFSARNLKQDILLGILGFVAEFPVAIFLTEISVTILRFMPKATHPASEALERSHDLRTVIPVLIAGSIIAPFWEEIVFRGMLFPGLKRLLGGIVPAAVLSSFLFACVHSQGITLWLPLAFVGATSCYLSHQSRSLVPGMVMHCLHNTAIFVMVMLT